MRWMKLELIIQSEVRQKEDNIVRDFRRMSHKTLTKFCEVALFRNSLLQCCAAVIAGRFFMFSGNCISSYTLPYEWYRMSLIVPLDSKEIQPVSRTGNQS